MSLHRFVTIKFHTLNSTAWIHITQLSINPCRCKSGRAKPKNLWADDVSKQYLMNQTANRDAFGVRSISPIKGSSAFAKQRNQIFESESVGALKRILDSRTDWDITVYTAAKQRAGYLRNVQFCLQIMHLALNKRNITPTSVLYGTLFHAFNINKRPSLSSKYLSEMIHVHKLIPDKVSATALLAGCAQTGDVDGTAKIWNEFILKYNVERDEPMYVKMIQTYGQNGDCIECRRLYDEFITQNGHPCITVCGAILASYVKSNQIEEALQIKTDLESHGRYLNAPGYLPLISFYVKDTAHFDP
eukprot:848616_1